MLRLLTLASLLVLPSSALAFCGFYVGGADATLYNDATMVVLMREGTTTVLSMQNTYQGPPEGFAMVVPVPEVLSEDNVRILPHEIFQRIDQLAAPRLVEYWEQDPCYVPRVRRTRNRSGLRPMSRRAVAESAPAPDLGVTIEAEFAVGEYDIVILSAEESNGLERWLHREQYAIPDGAGRVLGPYVQLGTKFFVAKVDPERVTFDGDRAVLSPLRVHYTSEQFSLPVRLGLLNSRGQQDLIMHVIAKQQRYEVANYANLTIPTNLTVDDGIRESFAGFYRALYDRVTEQNPGAVVTEYSWRATSCDPCPTTPLQPNELALLGADVLSGQPLPAADAPQARRAPPPGGFFGGGSDWTLTRLHYRYDEDDLTRDLVFREAPAIVGGRGTPDAEGQLQEKQAQPADVNNFQGRYVILHRWEGEIACQNPVRGRWGGPPGSGFGSRPPPPRPTPNPLLRQAAPTPVNDLNAVVLESDQPLLAVQATAAADTSLGVLPEPQIQEEPDPEPVDDTPGEVEASSGGCASCSASGAPGALALTLVAFALLLRRRR